MSDLTELIGWHTVAVRRFIGNGSNGPRYAPVADLPCTVTRETTIVVGATGSVQGTNTTLVFEAEHQALINQGALVVLPDESVEREVTGLSVTDAPAPFTGFDVGIAQVS